MAAALPRLLLRGQPAARRAVQAPAVAAALRPRAAPAAAAVQLPRRFMASSATSPAPRIERHRDFVRVLDGTGSHLDFHWFWLRHLCNETQFCRHPKTGERTLDAADVPLDIEPEQVSFDAARSELVVRWGPIPHAHESRYPLAWLQEHAYSRNETHVAPPESNLAAVTLRYRDYADGTGPASPAYYAAIRERLRRYGLVIVLGRGLDTEAIITDLLPAGADVIETHFGRIEDLRTDNVTNKNTDQLGYTDAPVNLHTDQPFIASPPGMQLLQCIRPADAGGESFLVDSRQAALYLRERDPEAFRILTTVPVKFHRKQKAFESIQVVPLIQLDAIGAIKEIRHSYFTLAPFHLPFSQMRAFYRAYQAFSAILHDRRNQFFYQLQSGDFVLYDNYRMLHARTGFSGPRHVRGVYFNHNDVWRKLDASAGGPAVTPTPEQLI